MSLTKWINQMDLNNETTPPQVNPGGVVQLPDGRFVLQEQYNQTMSHAEQMNAADPYVDPDAAVSADVPEMIASIPGEERESLPEADVPSTMTESDSVIDEAAEASEGDAPSEESNEEPNDDMESLAEEARAYDDMGYDEDAITAWTELPEKERLVSNPDGSVKLTHFDATAMTENQEAMLHYEVMTNGKLSPQHAEAFSQQYGMTVDQIQVQAANYRNAEIAKFEQASQNDAAELGMNNDDYVQMVGWYNNSMDAEKRADSLANLNNPALRRITLEGIRVLWQRDQQQMAKEVVQNAQSPMAPSTLPSDVAPVQQADGTWILRRVS